MLLIDIKMRKLLHAQQAICNNNNNNSIILRLFCDLLKAEQGFNNCKCEY